MLIALIFTAFACGLETCGGPIANPYPHAIRNADDAVATACVEWIKANPHPGYKNETACFYNFSGQFSDVDGTWVVRQNIPPRFAKGLTMYLNPKTGDMLEWIIFD